ncbi:hypothetical protein G9F71_008245 [Clostridium sp. FP2]|uniref:hypothetical protein n=1 Tax=Clostridium sp. FP2 TaxID=2724481 RepID=UPI0013E946D2|nr:hypothetical protein [Clostridium sp. FP2]MBZ9622841.1 hypothetical protein [Clostridium sp. FP2]
MINDSPIKTMDYGLVTSVFGNGKYGVTINDIESEIYALDNKIFAIRDVVIIIIGNNSFNTDKYILAKKPN